MRRARLALVSLILLVPVLSVAATESELYRDDFGDGNYSGNDGSLDFSGPWAEFGDGGGHGGGNVHVGPEHCSNNDCLHIEGEGLVLLPYGVTRSADLSMFENPELCFDIQVFPDPEAIPLGLNATQLQVQVNDGVRWSTIKTFDLSNPIHSPQHTLDVTAYRSEDFAVRFRVVGGLDLFYNGYATIDLVEITEAVDSPTTSTSSTTSTTTSTSSTSTTSTSVASTSTTKPGATTTSTTTSTTDSSRPDDRAATTTTTTVALDDGEDATTTTTTPGEDTSTTVAVFVGGPPGPPSDSGLRDPGTGLMADYSQGMMGDMGDVEVLGAELTADFSLAVEAFEGAKVWIAVLTLLIGAVIVSGMDSRRAEKTGRP